MKSSIGTRLKEFITYKKLTLEKFGDAFEATKGEVNNWCMGTKITVNRLAHMSKAYPDLNVHWLLLGEPHPMLNDTPPPDAVMEPAANYKPAAELLQQALKILKQLGDNPTG